MSRIGNIDIDEKVRDMIATITVKGHKKFRIKLYAGVALIRTGMWIMGVKGGVGVEYER